MMIATCPFCFEHLTIQTPDGAEPKPGELITCSECLTDFMLRSDGSTYCVPPGVVPH